MQHLLLLSLKEINVTSKLWDETVDERAVILNQKGDIESFREQCILKHYLYSYVAAFIQLKTRLPTWKRGYSYFSLAIFP